MHQKDVARVFVCFFLAACSPVLPGPIAAATPSLEMQTALPATPPGDPLPSATVAAMPTIASVMVSEPLIVPATPSTLPQPFKICSPIAGDALEDLPQIISDPYRPPPPGHEERHEGVDFSYYRRHGRTSIRGVAVQSILAGKVAMALSGTFPYGNVVIVETNLEALPAALSQRLGLEDGQSLYLLYAHMEAAPDVSLGDAVTACQQLGKVGKSGNAGVAHLHLETRTGPSGWTFAQMQYYVTSATPAEKATYKLWRTGGQFNHFDPMKLLAP